MGDLFIVATPIGNLEDITLRALNILKKVDIIACEDTRQTSKLLDRYNIKKTLISYHQHSKLTKIRKIIRMIQDENRNVAVVSDAGTPGISDPGQILIAEALRQDIKVVPIPGACALICALQASGINTSSFCFWGFVPTKKGRQSFIKKIKIAKTTIVVYESCYRIEKLLQTLGEQEVIVAKELTKIHEEFFRGKASDIKIETPKGEYVVVIAAHL